MKDLIQAVVEMQEEEALTLTKKCLADGVPTTRILEAYRDALAIIGQRFEQGEYFVSELMLSGEMMKAAAELIKPLASAGGTGTAAVGKFLLGTAEGDIHDIGKDMVGMLLEVSGFEVRDLGVDVPVALFLEECESFKPDVIGMSGLLSLAFEPMKAVVDGLAARGLRDGVKVIIGGGQMDAHACKFVGADAWARDAVAGVKQSLQWVGK